MIGYFNGNNQTLWVMIQGLTQTLLVRLPLAYFMSIQPDASLTKIGLAAPVSTAVGIVLNVLFLSIFSGSWRKHPPKGSNPLSETETKTGHVETSTCPVPIFLYFVTMQQLICCP